MVITSVTHSSEREKCVKQLGELNKKALQYLDRSIRRLPYAREFLRWALCCIPIIENYLRDFFNVFSNFTNGKEYGEHFFRILKSDSCLNDLEGLYGILLDRAPEDLEEGLREKVNKLQSDEKLCFRLMDLERFEHLERLKHFERLKQLDTLELEKLQRSLELPLSERISLCLCRISEHLLNVKRHIEHLAHVHPECNRNQMHSHCQAVFVRVAHSMYLRKLLNDIKDLIDSLGSNNTAISQEPDAKKLLDKIFEAKSFLSGLSSQDNQEEEESKGKGKSKD
ncbi:hypothetical protein FACS1894122_10530 [Alphaproteobacteria bacterium]|nr:hypothetical protein FACS1894122_10530 [Alphaproteobacteria bacterium]